MKRKIKPESFQIGTVLKEKDSQVDNAHQLVLYVEKEDLSYGPVQTGSYMVEHYLDDFFEKKDKLQTKRLEELKAGKISPLAYYKDLVDIGEGDLAARMGISRRKLRSHMTPEGFSKVSVKLLQRYATIFGIPVAQLFQIILTDDKKIALTTEKTGLAEVIISRLSIETTE